MTCNKSVNGGVKFFLQNKALLKNGGSALATSNSDLAVYMLDVSRYTQWESSGSSDIVTESITISFKSKQDIDRVFLTDMNLKNFSIKYKDEFGFYVDFANVIGVNGEESAAIAETDYSYSTAYFEFDLVNTDSILIEASETQVADQEKAITSFVATEEIGTFQGFPRVQPQATRNETKAKALSRRFVIQKTYETNRIKINFKSHPFQNDLDILDFIFDSEIPFLVYPCGGRTGEVYFKVDQKAWGLDDLFNMQTTGKMKNEFEKGVYTLGFKKTITLEEHV